VLIQAFPPVFNRSFRSFDFSTMCSIELVQLTCINQRRYSLVTTQNVLNEPSPIMQKYVENDSFVERMVLNLLTYFAS